jgi:hypothetical protein
MAKVIVEFESAAVHAHFDEATFPNVQKLEANIETLAQQKYPAGRLRAATDDGDEFLYLPSFDCRNAKHRRLVVQFIVACLDLELGPVMRGGR